MGEMSILGDEGDTKVIWDIENETEVEIAEDQFDALVAKGFTAFKVKKNGEAGGTMKNFNPKEGKIIFVPPIAGG